MRTKGRMLVVCGLEFDRTRFRSLLEYLLIEGTNFVSETGSSSIKVRYQHCFGGLLGK